MEEGDGKSEYTPGWYGTVQEAANNAVEAEEIDLNQIYELTFQARKKNPLHEYKAHLRPAN